MKEFNEMPLLKYNIEIISLEEHIALKKCYFFAIYIIVKELLKNKSEIKRKLFEIENVENKRCVIGCSRGRLRSPIFYLYCRYLGINAVVLKKGIKRFYCPPRRLIDYLDFRD